jgi:hypothetical protein
VVAAVIANAWALATRQRYEASAQEFKVFRINNEDLGKKKVPCDNQKIRGIDRLGQLVPD